MLLRKKIALARVSFDRFQQLRAGLEKELMPGADSAVAYAEIGHTLDYKNFQEMLAEALPDEIMRFSCPPQTDQEDWDRFPHPFYVPYICERAEIVGTLFIHYETRLTASHEIGFEKRGRVVCVEVNLPREALNDYTWVGKLPSQPYVKGLFDVKNLRL